MRQFHLLRHTDDTGVSGTGVVAEGVQFISGKCVLCWMPEPNGINIYDCIESLEKVHGHDGNTVIVWKDFKHRGAN